jgi:hypothetical protein
MMNSWEMGDGRCTFASHPRIHIHIVAIIQQKRHSPVIQVEIVVNNEEKTKVNNCCPSKNLFQLAVKVSLAAFLCSDTNGTATMMPYFTGGRIMMLCFNHRTIMTHLGILLLCTSPTTTSLVHAIRNSNNNNILHHRQNEFMLPHYKDEGNRNYRDLVSVSAGTETTTDEETEGLVEDVFRRLQGGDGGTGSSGRGSFLDQHLSHNTAASSYYYSTTDGGDESARNRQQHNNEYYYYYQHGKDIAIPQAYGKPPPNRHDNTTTHDNRHHHHYHNSDNTKGAKSSLHSTLPKKNKKEKKHRGTKRMKLFLVSFVWLYVFDAPGGALDWEE